MTGLKSQITGRGSHYVINKCGQGFELRVELFKERLQ